MCGFLGEYSFGAQLTDENTFKDLLALSKHRGPDATHTILKNNYQLGFNRLALLDLSEAGQQPKQSPSERFSLVFNGEVYNYLELAKQYQLKKLRSTSDTEVILHLFDAIGVIDTLKELNGMFAIAVIDNETNQLYLSRDFAGIKPLFYGLNKTGVVFASQFDQIFKHNWFKPNLKLRKDATLEYFMFGYMQSPNTIYEDIYQVNPGECLVIDKEAKVRNIKVLKFPKAFTASKSKNNLNKKLNHSVALQLNADRSLASFLSGGVDSSLICAKAKSQKKDIQAFTVEVEDEKLNEAEFAKKYAKHLGVKHKVKAITPDDLLSKVDEHFSSFPEPFGDYSSLPTYVITKEAVKYHTAMLSGDGGDELFFGYPRMYDVLKKKNWFKLPYGLRTNVVRVTNKIKLTQTHAPYIDSLEQFWMEKHTKFPKRIMKNSFEDVKISTEMQEMYQLNSKWNASELQHFLRWNEFYAHMQRVLIKVDRTSMKNSLEVRVPFLDKNVVEEAWQNLYDISDLRNLKKPLKDLVYKYLPKKMMLQEKKGFSVPMKDWLRTSLKADLKKTVFDTSFYGVETFDTQVLIDYVEDFLAENHHNEWGVWHIYAWQKWAINQGFVE